MANMQIYQFPNKAVLDGNDLFLLSDEAIPGHLTKNTTVAQTAAAVQALITSKDNFRYISVAGSDVSGTGTQENPWATMTYALSQITDAITTNPYKLIFSPGQYHEAAWSPKPNILVDFNGAIFIIDALVTLDAAWSSGGILIVENSNNLQLLGGMSLDFLAVGSPFALLIIKNHVLGVGGTWTINGNSGGGTVVEVENVFSLAAQIDYVVTDCYGGIGLGAAGSVTWDHTSETTGTNFNFKDLDILGDYTVNDSTTAGATVTFAGSIALGNTVYTATGAGALNIRHVASDYIGTWKLDGATVNFVPDTIKSLPILAGGAVFNPATLADGVLSNASFSNFTPTNSSVKGALQGINTELGRFGRMKFYASFGSDVAGNGTAGRPYATYAFTVSTISDAAANRPYLVVQMDNYTAPGDFVLYPFINVIGVPGATLFVTGDITIDASFATTVAPITTMENLILGSIGSGNFNIIFTAPQAAILRFLNLYTNTIPGPSGTFTGTGSETILFSNANLESTGFALGGYAFDGVNVNIQNNVPSDIYVSNSTGSLISVNVSNNTQVDTIGLTNTSGGIQATIDSSPLNAWSLDGTGNAVTIDASSYTVIPTFSSGASINDITLKSLTDGILQSSYTPVHYTAVGASNYRANSLTASLRGIDNALAGAGSASSGTFVFGQSNLTNILSITTAYAIYQKIGSIVYVNMRFNLVASAGSGGFFDITPSNPATGNFSTFGGVVQAALIGANYYGGGAPAGSTLVTDANVTAVMQLDATQSIRIYNRWTTLTAYDVNLAFSYMIQP